MSNRHWETSSWDFRLEPPLARVITDSRTRYTLEMGVREFRVELHWQMPCEEGDTAILLGVACLWELNARGERMEINQRVKKAVVDVFNRRFDRDKQFEKEIRARAQRWHDEGY